jgi:hypothetical protein
MKKSPVISAQKLVLSALVLCAPVALFARTRDNEPTAAQLDAINDIALLDENLQEDQKIEHLITLLMLFAQTITHLAEHPEEVNEQTNNTLIEIMAAIITASLDTTLAQDLAALTDDATPLIEKAPITRTAKTKPQEPKEQTLPAGIDEETRELIRQTFAAIFSNAAGILANPRNPQNVSTCISNMVGSVISAIMTSNGRKNQDPTVKRITRTVCAVAHDEQLLADIDELII